MRMPRGRLARLVTGSILVGATSVAPGLLAPDAVSAHTELESTTPADGESVAEPVAEVVVSFTQPVTLLGNGFEVLDPQGRRLEPQVVTDDDTTFRLRLDPPIAGGDAGVRYSVTAQDGHVIEGGFSFTIAAPEPSETPAAPPATAAPEPTTSASEAAPPATPSSSAPATGDTVGEAARAGTSDTSDADAVLAAAVGSGGSAAGSSDAAVYVALALALATGGVGFFLIRSRSSAKR